MKKLFGIFMVISFLCLPLAVMAQVDMTPVSELDFLQQLLQFVGGVKGMASAAAILAGVQVVIMFLKTAWAGKVFAKLTGDMKMLVVTFLTIIAGYLSMKIAGVPASEALLKTLALPMVQEFLYQVYKQFIAKKA